MSRADYEALAREAHALVTEHGAVSTAARMAGIADATLRNRYMAAIRMGLPPVPTPAIGQHQAAPTPGAPDTSREIRDLAFWKNKARAAETELATALHIVEELAGINRLDPGVPEWAIVTPSNRHSAVIGLHISDVHAGEVVVADEILGMNAFDLGICRDRLRRYFHASCVLGARWAADCDVAGALITLGGDLISGDIHEELRMTNACTSHEQVAFMVSELAAGILHVREAFGAVHVACVPGNHGRTTIKSTAKLYSRLSYDTLIGKLLAEKLAGEPGITVQVAHGADLSIPILGRTVFLTHGDKIGTGGGQGFAGPMLPIVRGAKKVEAQQARVGRKPDLILCGHFHSSGNPFGILANGSVPGYTEYGNGLRAAVEPPMQWTYLLHARWGLRERAEIVLSDPTPPPKPRVSVPAVMRRAA